MIFITFVDNGSYKLIFFSYIKFMAVHVYNIKAFVQLDTECILEVWLKDLHIDGSILKNAKSLLATLNVTDAFMSVLKSNSLSKQKTKVAAFSFGITMETVLVAQGPLSVEVSISENCFFWKQ